MEMKLAKFLLDDGKVLILVDQENGMRAHVIKVKDGYSARIQDFDSGEFVGELRIYSTPEGAINWAEKTIAWSDAPLLLVLEK